MAKQSKRNLANAAKKEKRAKPETTKYAAKGGAYKYESKRRPR